MSERDGKKSKLAVFASRLVSTLALWGVVVGVFLSDAPWAFTALVLFLALAGLWEFLKLFQSAPGRGSRNIAALLGLGLLAGLAWGMANRELSGLADFRWEMAGGIFALILGACWRFRHGIEGRESVEAMNSGLLTFFYVPVMFGSFVLRLLFLPLEVTGAVPGAWLVLLMITSAKFTDMGAYATGSLIGKHKMSPKISPGKTWEGFFGALLFAQAGAWGIWALGGEALAWLGGVHVGVLGLLMALSAVSGDLVESVMKRSLAVKDSGKWLPGIGGSLDLIDSLCFAAPVMYFYLLACGLI
ncbi:MAG: phosphatidate cytidylyltransferase [Verrucomicrobiales bacterium]